MIWHSNADSRNLSQFLWINSYHHALKSSWKKENSSFNINVLTLNRDCHSNCAIYSSTDDRCIYKGRWTWTAIITTLFNTCTSWLLQRWKLPYAFKFFFSIFSQLRRNRAFHLSHSLSIFSTCTWSYVTNQRNATYRQLSLLLYFASLWK